MANRPIKRETESERRKRRVRTRRLVVSFFAFIGVVIILESPLLRLRSIRVTGNGTIPAGRIIKESQLRRGMSLWQVSGAAVSAYVQRQEPLVQSVHAKTDYLHGRVLLSVFQKHVVALLDTGGQFYSLLNDGTVYQVVSTAQGISWPVISVASTPVTLGQPLANDAVSSLCKDLAKVSPSLLGQISNLGVDTSGIVTVYLENGFAGQINEPALVARLPDLLTAVRYFSGKGYAPGLIIMTGAPPYEYTPFQSGKAGKKK